MPLTNNVLTEVNRVRVRYILYNMVKVLYILGIVAFCAYAKYIGWYGFWYERILNFVLTANIIWLYFDIFQSPLKIMLKAIQDTNGKRNINR